MDNFYWEHYVKTNPDIYPQTKENAWQHLINIGLKKKVYFSAYPNKDNFDHEHYIDLYDDLKNIGIITHELAWNHWIETGKNEGRIVGILDERKIFDFNKYISFYVDLQNANINTEKQAWYHWVNQGRYEGRIFFNNDSYNSDFYFENYLQMYKLVKLENIYNREQAYNNWLKNKDQNIKLTYLNYKDFDHDHYMNLYNETFNHWETYGKYEGYIIGDLKDKKKFDWNKYLIYNDDLKRSGINTYEKAWYHWVNQGRFEGRTFTCIDVNFILDIDFNDKVLQFKDEIKKTPSPRFSKKRNNSINYDEFINDNLKKIVLSDINITEDNTIINTTETVNFDSIDDLLNDIPTKSNNISDINIIDDLFDEKNNTQVTNTTINTSNNSEINSDEEIDQHEILNQPEILNNIEIMDYYYKIDEFCKKYNYTQTKVFNDAKLEYRYFCYRYLDYIRNIELPEIPKRTNYEAVLIEFRCFLHLEFVLRNTINKLGNKWCHTIVCGNINYEFVKEMAQKISENINVINSGYDNMDQNDYSIYLTTKDFWNLLSGEKVLIYQEDTCVFKKNIDEFINFDYIGAPWRKNQDDTPNRVGNGGFSLRTRQCMLDVINKVSLKHSDANESTLEYMRNFGLEYLPEDVYFSLNMQKYNIGVVSDWETARRFSIETVYYDDSFAGHNFWLCDKNWKEKLYTTVVIQFKPMYNIDLLEHRGGWKYVINHLIKNDFYNPESEIYFYDIIENYFLFSDAHVIDRKWAGIIHYTPNTPQYLESVNIQNLFLKKKFIDSLNNCMFIVTLSTYILNYLKQQFNLLNLNINVIMLKHPVINDNIPFFNIQNYINNNNKYIIQIGQQLRKMTSIFLIGVQDIKKLWLFGTKNYDKCKYLLNEEIKYLKIKDINIDSVSFYYTETFDEYDELLVKNIVFVDLFDAGANNTILECIIRNTPIIVNKLESVVEYLGENYPLYFNDLKDVSELLTTQKILSGYTYLKNMNKEDLTINNFTKKLFSNIKINNIKPKQKILAIHTPYGLGLGGGEKFILDIANYFILFKNTIVIIFTNEKLEIAELTIKKLLGQNYIEIIKIIPEHEMYNWSGKIDYFFSMCNSKLPIVHGLANKHENNIFHCQFPFDLGRHNTRNTLLTYKHIILNSDFTKYFYVKHTQKYLTDHNIKIIYPNCYSSVNIYNMYTKKPCSFVMIGRIFAYNPNANNKNFDIALKYFEQIESIGGKYVLHIVGQNYSNSFLNYLKSFNCKNVIFHINASEEEKNNILSESQYIINMVGINRHLENECYAYEHFGISILEGINYGCIPITINGGFPACYISNNVNGLVFSNEKEFYDIIYNITIKKKQYKFNFDFFDSFLERFTTNSYNKLLNDTLKSI